MESYLCFAFPSDFVSVFRLDDGLQARPVMASPEPANIRADRITARFNPSAISVNGFDLRDEILADISLQDIVEKPFDIFCAIYPDYPSG